MVIIVTLHMRIEWSVSFPVQWYNFHYGGGETGLSGDMPPGFFFSQISNFTKISYTGSWDALHLFQSRGIIFIWGGSGTGGHAPSNFFLFTK